MSELADGWHLTTEQLLERAEARVETLVASLKAMLGTCSTLAEVDSNIMEALREVGRG
jgi:hypothetical protein